jgi:PAS domain S-box-containing protein
MVSDKAGQSKFNQLRKRAEELLVDKEGYLPPMSSDEIREIVHELHTHQIELELQNEDMRQVQEELLVSQRKYHDLYEFAPVGYLTANDNGLIIEANLTLTKMLGMERRSLIKRPLSHFIVAEDQDVFYLYRKNLLATQERQAFELQMRKKGGERFWAGMDAVLVEDVDEGRFRIAVSDITGRKRAEKRFHEQRELLLAALDSLTQPFYIIDPKDYSVTLANRASGFDELQPRESCYSLLHKRSEPCTGCNYPCPLRIVNETGKPTTVEHFHYDQGGIERLFEVHAYPMFDNAGKVSQVIVTCLDITDRKRAEDALQKAHAELEHKVQVRTYELSRTNRELQNEIRERRQAEQGLRQSEEKFRLSFENAKDAIFWADPKTGLISKCNRAAELLLEKKREEIIGQNQTTLHPPEQTAYYRDMFSRDITAKGADNEGEVITKTGRIVPVHITASVTVIGGKPIIQGIFRDISDRKRAEEEKNTERQRLYSLLDTIPAFVYLQAPDYSIRFANKYYKARFGEPEGKPCYKSLWGRNEPCEVCHTFKVFETKQPQKWEWDSAPDGRTYEINDYPFTDSDGTELVFELGMDISERKGMAEALQKAHDELEQRVEERTIELQKTHEQLLHAEKLSAIGKLSASIAHEFNNPLQGLMNIVKGVSKRASLDADDTELMDIAISECHRMRDLIRSLQNFNRPTSGRPASIDIHALMDSILLLNKKEYKTREITVEKIYAENIPRIKAVADQIKQVLLNLLNNAADACKRGGTITIRTEAHKGIIVIRIRNTGIGIRPEDKDHIFEPFFTTKPEVKGTGLGLSVSYGIIKAHGGDINVESKPGKGTTFSIILPIEGVQDVE